MPEGDWLCYNCDIFGMKRGLTVQCLLCPKKGGAMKPTNIFCTLEKYKIFNKAESSNASNKKSAKKNGGKLGGGASEDFGKS